MEKELVIPEVAVVACQNYDETTVKQAFDELEPLLGNLAWVTKGMKIAIKANLVTFMKPEKAGTTHPSLLVELVKRLLAKGAEVVVGDSPGGPYNAINLNSVYAATGMKDVEACGAKLNNSYEVEIAQFPEGVSLKEIPYTAYLKEADAIINFCKLKSHGMMGMSAAVKNLFGIIPGTRKPEFHFRFPEYSDFANMIVDLNEFLKPKVKLCIVDAVVAMEGNGPTSGTPKPVGLLLASQNPYFLDDICAKLIGLERENVPTLEAAFQRGLLPKTVSDIVCNQPIEPLLVTDFDTRKVHKSLEFKDKSQWLGKALKCFLQSKPNVTKKECVGCGKCAEVCPAKAITIEQKVAKIDRKKCITCFCCQEFCPTGAMKVKRTQISKWLTK